MGIIVNKENNKNNNLTRRIDADLKQKLSNSPDIDGSETDFATDSEYTKDLKKTSKFGWVWVVLILLAILSLIFIILL